MVQSLGFESDLAIAQITVKLLRQKRRKRNLTMSERRELSANRSIIQKAERWIEMCV